MRNDPVEIVAVARAIYEAAPMTGNFISINTATIGDAYVISFDEIEASASGIYEQIIAIAEAAVAVYRRTLEPVSTLGGIVDRGHI